MNLPLSSGFKIILKGLTIAIIAYILYEFGILQILQFLSDIFSEIFEKKIMHCSSMDGVEGGSSSSSSNFNFDDNCGCGHGDTDSHDDSTCRHRVVKKQPQSEIRDLLCCICGRGCPDLTCESDTCACTVHTVCHLHPD